MAGKERTLNLSKVDPVETWWKSRFAPHDRIAELAAQMAGEIKAWNRLKGLSQADFTAGITKVYVMANHTPPRISRVTGAVRRRCCRSSRGTPAINCALRTLKSVAGIWLRRAAGPR